jgi:hypothetical protein
MAISDVPIPVVIVTYGRSDQAVHEFLDRLERSSLPRHLKRNGLSRHPELEECALASRGLAESARRNTSQNGTTGSDSQPVGYAA